MYSIYVITYNCYLGDEIKAFIMISISSNGTAVRAATMFARGSGPILLSGLQCNGTEDSLADCRPGGWGITPGCDHNRDAGVICGKWYIGLTH